MSMELIPSSTQLKRFQLFIGDDQTSLFPHWGSKSHYSGESKISFPGTQSALQGPQQKIPFPPHRHPMLFHCKSRLHRQLKD